VVGEESPVKRMVLCAAFFLVVLVASGQAVQSPQTAPGSESTEPKQPIDWLTRAAGRLEIRQAGAAAFHLRANLHAYQGIDFSPPGQSTMVTGNGTYEEWWVSPEKWRREVTLGSYHALEAMSGGVRKFQASSDYEPSRVLMLLRALDEPISPHIVHPDPQHRHVKWKMEPMPDDLLHRTRISDAADKDGWGPAFQFLPDGTLVRLENGFTGIVTTWRNQTEFAGKQVPGHIAVGGEGLGREMLSADLAIEPLGKVDEAQFQLPGPAADASATLRPIDRSKVKDLKLTHAERVLPGTIFAELPVGVRIIVRSVVDREGTPREVEVAGIQNVGQPLTRDQVAGTQGEAQLMVQAIQKHRYHPAEINGHPCELEQSDSSNNNGEAAGSVRILR